MVLSLLRIKRLKNNNLLLILFFFFFFYIFQFFVILLFLHFTLKSLDNEGRIVVGLREDNLVRMAGQSHSHSSLSPENTAKKTSKKMKEQKKGKMNKDFALEVFLLSKT